MSTTLELETQEKPALPDPDMTKLRQYAIVVAQEKDPKRTITELCDGNRTLAAKVIRLFLISTADPVRAGSAVSFTVRGGGIRTTVVMSTARLEAETEDINPEMSVAELQKRMRCGLTNFL
ncbi:MAG: hypothetical protein HOO67_03035 [Candidatus Peribacteraceae bacterium]|nr:hypothetical protein [Candidatus Peribacteraceae bacterium]